MKQLLSVRNNCRSICSFVDVFRNCTTCCRIFFFYPLKVLSDILLHYLDRSGVFFSGWMSWSSSLVTYSPALPYFFSPSLPREAAKNIFSQTVKGGGENERLRSQSCQEAAGPDVFVCVFSKILPMRRRMVFFFFLREEELVKSFDTLGLTGV